MMPEFYLGAQHKVSLSMGIDELEALMTMLRFYTPKIEHEGMYGGCSGALMRTVQEQIYAAWQQSRFLYLSAKPEERHALGTDGRRP